MPKSLPALISETDSMTKQEKGYWLEILPSMTKEQQDWLKKILQTEADKMEELEKKYGGQVIDDAEKAFLGAWELYQLTK